MPFVVDATWAREDQSLFMLKFQIQPIFLFLQCHVGRKQSRELAMSEGAHNFVCSMVEEEMMTTYTRLFFGMK